MNLGIELDPISSSKSFRAPTVTFWVILGPRATDSITFDTFFSYRFSRSHNNI